MIKVVELMRVARFDSRQRLRRYPWSVLRLAQAFPSRRRCAGHQIHFHGRLCGSRLLQRRVYRAVPRFEGALPRPHHAAPRQPRGTPDHAGVRFLRRVHAEVRKHERVEVLRRRVRLPEHCGSDRRQDHVCARRHFSVHPHRGPHQQHLPFPGGGERGSLRRSAVVGSGGGDSGVWIANLYSPRFQRNFRGAGWIFGGDVAHEFNQINGLELVCRAHQPAMEGYQYFFDEAFCTVWSAPNYCYRSGNLASILQLDESRNRHFEVFNEEAPENRTLPSSQSVRYML